MTVRGRAITSNVYLFVGYLMTLSVAILCRAELVNDNSERIWKEAVVTNRGNNHSFAWRD
jgi:hypothetical protein